MSEQGNFSRTTNQTIYPIIGSKNRSNESDSDLGRGNGSRPGYDRIDESPQIMFYLLSTLVIPSILCFLFLFYKFLRLPQLRTKSTNLLIVCLLIINFVHILVDLPFRLYYLFENHVPSSNLLFCRLWTWYDDILTTADLLIMAFISIERYFSIFRHTFLRNHQRLFYQIPIALCLGIPTIWYTILIFGYPCQSYLSYFTFQCGTMCYLTSSQVFVNFENFVFFMFPLLIIVMSNGTLITHVLVQKKNMKRKRCLSVWRNNLRMISQLMFIAVLYMSIYVPSCILLIFGSYLRRNRFQPWAVNVRSRYFTHLKYLVTFGCPFMVLAGRKEMHKIIKKLFCPTIYLWRLPWRNQTVPVRIVPSGLNGTIAKRHS